MAEERTLRETIEDPLSYTFRNEQLEWSGWREAIVPNNVAEAGDLYTPRNPRQDVATHCYNNETRQALQNDCNNGGTCCGIYELKVVRGERKAVVYIGFTDRESKGSLHRRLFEYMNHGSHISHIIQRALDRGFSIYARWMKLSQEHCQVRDNGIQRAKELEGEHLAKYNYAWNQRNNGNRRNIHGISVSD